MITQRPWNKQKFSPVGALWAGFLDHLDIPTVRSPCYIDLLCVPLQNHL